MKLKYPYLDSMDSIEENINKVLASAAFPGAYTPVRGGWKNLHWAERWIMRLCILLSKPGTGIFW